MHFSVHSYCPNQLALPSILNEKLSALEGASNNKVVSGNLNAMHTAKKQFIACEFSEKLRCVLCPQVRTSIAQSYKDVGGVLVV